MEKCPNRANTQKGCGNYRRISLLSVLSKILGIQDNLSDTQCGFRGQKSIYRTTNGGEITITKCSR
jgi:hypothetical protein